jgi:hypothetical protein
LVGTKIKEPPTFHGLNDLEELLKNYEEEVLENHRFLSLDITIKETPTRWWGAHKETIQDWYQFKRLLCIRFGIEHERNILQKYDGCGRPVEHLEKCITQWSLTTPEKWPHYFIHTLEGIPWNWYID